jgi:exosortase D (VPLPA-CTERM-specific)
MISKTETNADRFPMQFWPLIYIVIALASVMYIFSDGLNYMLQDWEREEFSHGYMIPLISLYLLMQQLPKLSTIEFKHQLWGVLIIVFGMGVFLAGELSALYVIVQYAFLLVLYGICISLIGFRGLIILTIPFIYLLFMIPLPNFLLFSLSQKLQLLSSGLGVFFLRLMDVSVYLEGNIIDLGSYKLQVVDACSGLRYLFPLMSFGFLVAYLYKTSFWKRAVIFLSTIPITIFMNSFRIAIIGLTVDIWGISAAEGVLHDFEGWIIFIACLILLGIEILLMEWISGNKSRLRDNLDVHLPKTILPPELIKKFRKVNSASAIAVILLLMLVPVKNLMVKRQEIIPDRLELNSLPLIFDNWVGRESRLDKDVLDALQVNDYFIANYQNSNQSEVVNLYIAYYDSQRKGASVHSPKTCLPGGGWEIAEFDRKTLSDIKIYPGKNLEVNRVVIQNGEVKQLVYYWFQQRGRVITNEYLLKWYLFQDALTRNRTDGSLVRVIANISSADSIENVETEMQSFIAKLAPSLPAYIPE